MKRQATLFFVLLCSLFFTGCGGSDRSAQPASVTKQALGSLHMTVRWPHLTRLVPVATQSIQVVLTANGQQVGQQLIVRPASGTDLSNIVFDSLPTVDIIMQATAFPANDGTGNAQASGTVMITVQSGSVTNAALTMNSTISQIVVSPATPSVIVGQSVQLVASAQDAQGAVVLVDPSKWLWQVDNASLASLTPTGDHLLLNGLGVGSVNVTVTDQESTKSVQVTAGIVAEGSGGQIAGTVTDTSGNPVSGAQIETSDGASLFKATADVNGNYLLPSVPSGSRVVTFSGSGQTTSYQVTVARGGTVTLNAVLAAFSGGITGPPVIHLNAPRVDNILGQATLSGTIDQLDSTNAVMIVNGEEQLIPVNGSFLAVAILRSGTNVIYIKATNGLGSVLSEKQQITFIPTGKDYFFRATLSWDGSGDLDLHTWDPLLAHSSYHNKVIGSGDLDTDNVTSYGPENFSCRQAIPGRYEIAINSFGSARGRNALVQVTINRGPNAGKTYHYGPYKFADSNANSGYPITGNTASWWRPVDVVIGADGTVAVDTPDLTIPLPSPGGRAVMKKKESFTPRRSLLSPGTAQR